MWQKIKAKNLAAKIEEFRNSGTQKNGSNERKITAEFTISIESVKYLESLYYVYENYDGWGQKCCQTADLFDAQSQFFVDGELTVRVKGTFTAQRSLVTVSLVFVAELL